MKDITCKELIQLLLTGNKNFDAYRFLTEFKFIIDSQNFKKEFYDEIVDKYLKLADTYGAALLIGRKEK